MKRIVTATLVALMVLSASAQSDLKKIYDETADPALQIRQAVAKADSQDKFVICQVGGNWCRWCLIFADFITRDSEISELIDSNFVYIHVNYNPRDRNNAEKAAKARKIMESLGNPDRFGFPALVVLDEDGKVVHIQDSSFLEEGNSYSKEKVMRFLKNWTPEAVRK